MAEYEQKLDDIGNKISLGLEQEWFKGMDEEHDSSIVNNSLDDLTDEAGYGKINVYSSEALKEAEEVASDVIQTMKVLFPESGSDFDYSEALKFLYLGRKLAKKKMMLFFKNITCLTILALLLD